MAKTRKTAKTTTKKNAPRARKGAGVAAKKRVTAKAARKPATRATRPVANVAPTPDDNAASGRFVRDLLVRGEAAPPDARGKLTAKATHVVTGQSANGTLTVKRVRFKAF